MDILLAILLAAGASAAVVGTLWHLPRDGHGQNVAGTNDWNDPRRS